MPGHPIDQALSRAMAASDNATMLKHCSDRYYQLFPDRVASENDASANCLAGMLTQYGQLLPALIAQLRDRCQQTELAPVMNKLDRIVSDFFVEIDTAQLDYGFIGLLDKLYFGHRLMEEFHDQLRLQAGHPVLPWDLSLANLIVHGLIGDEYANRLDMAVMEVIDGLNIPSFDWPGTPSQACPAYPCLAGYHGLSLSLGN
ncbi:MAG: hypothetical protein ACX931_02880 [Saccharospirillum sp.]